MSAAVWLHTAHIGVLGVAGGAIGAALMRSRPSQRSVQRLREAVGSDALVARAERRAVDLFEREERYRPSAVLLIAATVTAAAVHGSVCPGHFREAWRFGTFFLLATVVQFALAFGVASGRRHLAVPASVLVNGGCVLLWSVTRTVGLPFGLTEVEPVGSWDLLATVAELAAVAAALRLVARPALRPLPAPVAVLVGR